MIGVGAGMATHAASSAAGTLASQLIVQWFTGFNPSYNKEDRRKMRYIQQKYAQAYGAGLAGDDAGSIILQIDPGHRLLMDLEGKKPANPFPDERSFEDSLQLNFHPVSGHQGRFVASHAMSCLGVIIDYQNRRRRRQWIPGVMSPGRPNDYINLFLEETKVWLKTQLTLDSIHAEELERRDSFYTKLKNDNYYWCFPPESESCSIHKVISFVHDKVKNAHEMVSREEKNKSLQSLFKELNDHTTNAFEFGKTFLAYLLYPDRSAGSNLASNMKLDGKTLENGKLHRLLEQSTESVFKAYVEDMNDSIANQKSPEMKALENRTSNVLSQTQIDNIIQRGDYTYSINVSDYEEVIVTLKGVLYLIEIKDPKGHKWIVRKTYADCETLHNMLITHVMDENKYKFDFPAKISKLFPKREDYLEMCAELTQYFQAVFDELSQFEKPVADAIGVFVEAKYMIIPVNKTVKRAEAMPNMFLKLKKEFTDQLVAKNATAKDDSSSASADSESQPKVMSKSMVAFRKTWGIEWVIKIFEAYSHLQRMATILGWTLEINHFFVSMFGNTLAFSKLPLKDILSTQKDIMSNFLNIANDIYKFACKLNCDQQYKWHKNLQMTENELIRLRFHIEKSISIINSIESDHLDYEAQMRRLRDVTARFQPLMNRIDCNLIGIQQELGLPSSSTVAPGLLTSSASTNPNARIANGDNGMQAITDGGGNNKVNPSSLKYLTNNADSKSDFVNSPSSKDEYLMLSDRVEELPVMSSNPLPTSNKSTPTKNHIRNPSSNTSEDNFHRVDNSRSSAKAPTVNNETHSDVCIVS